MEVHHSLQGSLYDLAILSHGVSGVVFELPDSTVVKVPCGSDQSREELAIESTIYNRLGSHPYITKFLYTYKGMIVLERLQYPLRKRLWDLRNAGAPPPATDVLRWAIQISQALQHAHSRCVFQVDIGPHNILLDGFEDAKLSDFAGSSIDGSAPSVLPSPHSQYPNMLKPSIQSEMFALGSTLYEIETTQQPYCDKSDKDVEELFRAGDFPDTSALMLGEVISKCWRAEYEDVGEAVKDITRIQRKYANAVEKRHGIV
ncbi:kinase-like protein [Trematosphaeria pertusa]|uniref:Kinase-like protein n=1 Tax=Trematosphaeria pertusa TaxID=390896 RepID=A0A6A6IVV0_9PLEO|nr:kinase-like protein [Trematosphaeria pertusa]KAF2254544.1 kinase-like protein [Trematosphaeria pertusa]